MVGAYSSNTAQLGAQIDLDPFSASTLSKILVSLAYMDNNSNIITVGSPGTVDVSSKIAYFSTTSYPLDVEKDYFVLAWVDKNGDGIFSSGENYGSTYQRYSVRLVSDAAYSNAQNTLNILAASWNFLGLNYAVAFLNAFLNDSYIDLPGVTQLTSTVSNTTARLSENTGAMWNNLGVATIKFNVFSANSDLADSIRNSSEFTADINSYLTAGKSTVQSYTWLPGETQHLFTFIGPTSISFTADANLHYSIGKAELIGVNFNATVRKSDLALIQLDITGKLNDLYDFDNQAAAFAVQGAQVQAGFQNNVTGKAHGQIYETDVQLDKTNFPFTFSFQ